MLLEEVEKVIEKPVTIVGYRIEASLNQALDGQLIEGLRERLVEEITQLTGEAPASMLLMQIYADEEWTPDVVFTHIVAVQAESLLESAEREHALKRKGMTTHIIPEGEYLRFTHQGDEQSIDESHLKINDWLAENGYPDDRPFDIEWWHTLDALQDASNQVMIYVPI